MTLWMRLACCCACVVGCGPPPPGGGAPDSPGELPCAPSAAGTGHAAALLRIGCDGGVAPGRASWSREGDAVILAFADSSEGPVGVGLVSSWPPLDQPPWLGHRIENIAVLAGTRVRVRFGAMPGAAPDEPERLFADPRLSGVPVTAVEGDARDEIDAARAPVLTRHDASVEYARSLGRALRLVAFDRLYLVAFAGDVELDEAAALGRAIGADWTARGAAGARRAASADWRALGERCGGAGAPGGVAGERGIGSGRRGGVVAAGDETGPATVGYPAGDRAARQIAERVVSLAMREGPGGGPLRALAGIRARLAVRAAMEWPPRRATSDVAAVMTVRAGPGHPCSLHAEAARELAEWGLDRDTDRAHVIAVGEAALFEVGVPGDRAAGNGKARAAPTTGRGTWRR